MNLFLVGLLLTTNLWLIVPYCINKKQHENNNVVLQSMEEVQTFLNGENTFEDYCAEAVKYVELAREIPSKLEGTIVIGMFQMQRGELITSLRTGASRLANTLLRRMTEDYQTKVKALVVDFVIT